MSVIDLRAYVDPSISPTLLLIDMQQEYLASPRALAIPDPVEALSNCREALAHARRMGFPVAFTRWRGQAPYFNSATRFWRWIEGFEPMGVDMVFERDRPSCYASEQFAEVIGASGGHIAIAGFAGEAACLSTALDAYHRGHSFTFLQDASASHPLGDLGANEVHRAVATIISVYDRVMETAAWVAATLRTRQQSARRR